MKLPTLLNINRSQEEYLDLLLQYKEYVQAVGLSVTKICALLDEVKCFWLKRLKPIEFELEELAEGQTCFVLSGAIFLDTSEYEHYFFKSLGDYHIISDPFSKFEMIFRHPEDEINVAYTVDYFKRAFLDTIEILTTYKGYFYVLPIQEIAVEYPQKHGEFIEMFFWKFVSGTFDDEFKSNEDFYKKYKSFEEVEAGLSSHVRDHLVFNNLSDGNLPLRERVEKYSGQYTNISSGIDVKSDAQSFLIAVFSYIAQIADILYVCSVLRINPYIRFGITFAYFILAMSVFVNDDNLKRMIEKTLVCYLFHRTVDVSRFKNITFLDYYKRLEDRPLLNSILEKVHAQEIDIFKDETSKVVKIIEEEFEAIF